MMRMIGSRRSCAICSAISGFSRIVASAEPPRTVKSSPTTTTGRPSIWARPITQFDGTSSTSLPCSSYSARAGDRADLVEAAAIDQTVDALADGELAGIVLALDLVGAAEPPREFLALAQLVQFRLPSHRALRSCLGRDFITVAPSQRNHQQRVDLLAVEHDGAFDETELRPGTCRCGRDSGRSRTGCFRRHA